MMLVQGGSLVLNATMGIDESYKQQAFGQHISLACLKFVEFEVKRVWEGLVMFIPRGYR